VSRVPQFEQPVTPCTLRGGPVPGRDSVGRSGELALYTSQIDVPVRPCPTDRHRIHLSPQTRVLHGTEHGRIAVTRSEVQQMAADAVGAGLDGPVGPRSVLPTPHPSPSTQRTSAAPVSGDHAFRPKHPARPGWVAGRRVHWATPECPPIRSRVVRPGPSEQFAPSCSAPP
jgi:hypothetical protein